jgi:GNAT superfamily N-acetyltransferase
MTDCTIRPAAVADAAAIGNLVAQLGYPTSTENMRARLAQVLARPDYVTLVAESAGQIVGLGGAFLHPSLEYDGEYARLTGLVVDRARRGTGVGKLLLERIETWARDRGARKMTLTSGKQRNEAHAFYRRLGYAETGLRFAKDL